MVDTNMNKDSNKPQYGDNMNRDIKPGQSSTSDFNSQSSKRDASKADVPTSGAADQNADLDDEDLEQ